MITGGNSGLGKATAALLIEKGADVLITGRNSKKTEKVAQTLNCKHLVFDISEINKIEVAAKQCLEVLNGVDVLVNSAEIGEFGLLEELDYSEFESVFNTNVFGLTMFTQAILPNLKTSKGDIVNIASTASLKGFAYGSIYAASKFALRGLTQCWQVELSKHNVRVIQINPSEVPTAFNQADRNEKELVDGKLTPQEIAHIIVSSLEMDARGFIPEVTVWAINLNMNTF